MSKEDRNSKAKARLEAARAKKDERLARSRAKSAEAVEGLREVREDLRKNNETFKEGVAGARAEKAERDEVRHAKDAERREQNAADWAAKKDELREDRKDRRLGGWGRKKKSDDG